MMPLAGFIVTLLGLVVLSLSIKRHYREAFTQYEYPSDRQVRILKAFGTLFLFVAIKIGQAAKGLPLGLVYFFAWVSLAGLILSLLLSYRPGWMQGLIPMLVIAVPISAYFC